MTASQVIGILEPHGGRAAPPTAAVAEPPAGASADGGGDVAPRKPPRILVVDDEREILELLAECLEGAGYAVTTADSGAAALAMLAREPAPLLLFTDVVMPGELDGFALARRARALRPDLKILFMSGYHEAAAGDVDLAGAELVRKPFRMDHAIARIEAILQRGAGAADQA